MGQRVDLNRFVPTSEFFLDSLGKQFSSWILWALYSISAHPTPQGVWRGSPQHHITAQPKHCSPKSCTEKVALKQSHLEGGGWRGPFPTGLKSADATGGAPFPQDPPPVHWGGSVMVSSKVLQSKVYPRLRKHVPAFRKNFPARKDITEDIQGHPLLIFGVTPPRPQWMAETLEWNKS